LIDGKITFGLCDIKNVGISVMDKLLVTIEESSKELDKEFKDWTWIDFLIFAAPSIKSNSLEAFINVGACDCFDISRVKMLFETNIVKEFTAKEIDWIKKNLRQETELSGILFQMIEDTPGRGKACSNINRFKKIEELLSGIKQTPYDMEDQSHVISMMEYELLGINLTATALDDCKQKYRANCSCEEFNDGFGKDGSNIALAVQIDDISRHKTKNGKNPGQEMAFLEVSDETGAVDSIVVFPECWHEYKNMVIEGNKLLLCGKRDGKNVDSFILELVEQL
jgi:DNA polymerase III alpha subunit